MTEICYLTVDQVTESCYLTVDQVTESCFLTVDPKTGICNNYIMIVCPFYSLLESNDHDFMIFFSHFLLQ